VCTVDACDEASDSCGHEASDVTCDDGEFCSGVEKCDPLSGCVAGDQPLDCSDLDSFCGIGICDEQSRECAAQPTNEGATCTDGDDLCTLSDVCADGQCVGEALCNPECELCLEGECFSLCGNPHESTLNLVTAVDGLYSLRAAVGLETCALCVCDVTGNGVISASDTLALIRYVVGLDSEMLCPGPAGDTTTTLNPTTTTLVTTTTVIE
jgi:hypothetical protein